MSKVYLIPSVLDEGTTAANAIPAYIKTAVEDCQVFFVENAKTTRRFFKSIWKEMVIDDYEWQVIGKVENEVINQFKQAIQLGKNVGIVSEAGCPAIADPGNILVAKAHELNATIVPLVGPSSILLALIASGFNGQHFTFNGYLPINADELKKKIKSLEQIVIQQKATQLFIETPYRNNAMFQHLMQNCLPTTKICIAKNLTSEKEWIVTKTVQQWKAQIPELHKEPVIFLIGT